MTLVRTPKFGEWGNSVESLVSSKFPKYGVRWRWWKRLAPRCVPLQGTGKGIWITTIGKLLEPHYVHLCSHKQLLGQFNSILAHRCLIFLDGVPHPTAAPTLIPSGSSATRRTRTGTRSIRATRSGRAAPRRGSHSRGPAANRPQH